jgi:hypothetical protein
MRLTQQAGRDASVTPAVVEVKFPLQRSWLPNDPEPAFTVEIPRLPDPFVAPARARSAGGR